MKSIFSLTVAATALLGASTVAAESLSGAALAYRQYKTLVEEGCYSSSTGLTKNSSYIYNSKGYCQLQCVPLNKAVQATSNADECWCGDEIPPASSKVDDSFCNSPCSGYGDEICGGDNYWTVYLTGTTTSAPNAASGSSSSTTSSATLSATPAASSTTSAKPSVVTVGGQTIVVTASASSSTSSGFSKSGGGGTNKAAIAAGVVVGIVAVGAIVGGLFLFLRHRRRREVEEEYRRNAAVSSFVAGGKPTSSAGASFTDTRLDPVMAQRRMSDGSIADNQDYSRRILKVTNA
jgi:cell wall integrity and stress response component